MCRRPPSRQPPSAWLLCTQRAGDARHRLCRGRLYRLRGEPLCIRLSCGSLTRKGSFGGALRSCGLSSSGASAAGDFARKDGRGGPRQINGPVGAPVDRELAAAKGDGDIRIALAITVENAGWRPCRRRESRPRRAPIRAFLCGSRKAAEQTPYLSCPERPDDFQIRGLFFEYLRSLRRSKKPRSAGCPSTGK